MHGEKYIPPRKKGQCSVLSFWKKNEKVVYEGKRVDEKNDQIAGSSSLLGVDIIYIDKEVDDENKEEIRLLVQVCCR